jgi:hypothetical protein
VEFLGELAFRRYYLGRLPLESLTFEPGSKLEKIDQMAFRGCNRLQRICLPASVRAIDGATFRSSHFSAIEIEADNPHFRVQGHFILDFAGVCIVSHFGPEREVEIPDDIEALGEWSFTATSLLESMSFGPSPRLRFIRKGAFLWCLFRSVHIPSSVLEIGDEGFSNCPRLARVTFEPKSELRRLGTSAFRDCTALESFCLPSSVEFVGRTCFSDCWQLSGLGFEMPSRVRELTSLPGLSPTPVVIPDSVEVLEVTMKSEPRGRTIEFGEQSRLEHIRLSYEFQGRAESSHIISVFLRIPAHRLKALCRNSEFAGEI